MKVVFTTNQYDSDGDLFDICILLQFGENAILRIKNDIELSEIIESLQRIKEELDE